MVRHLVDAVHIDVNADEEGAGEIGGNPLWYVSYRRYQGNIKELVWFCWKVAQFETMPAPFVAAVTLETHLFGPAAKITNSWKLWKNGTPVNIDETRARS